RWEGGGGRGGGGRGTDAPRRGGGTAGVDLAQFAAGGRRRAVAPEVRLVCLSTADRGLSPGGEDGLWRGGPAVRDGRGDAPDAGGAGDRGGAGAAISGGGPFGRGGAGRGGLHPRRMRCAPGVGPSGADGAGLRPGGRRTGRLLGPQVRCGTGLANPVARLSTAPGHGPGPANQGRSRDSRLQRISRYVNRTFIDVGKRQGVRP